MSILAGIAAAGAFGAAGHTAYQAKNKDYSDRSALAQRLSSSVTRSDYAEGFEGMPEELAVVQATDPQGLSEAMIEQGVDTATTAGGKQIAAQQAALEGSVGDQTSQSLKRSQMILEEGGDTIAETTAGTTAGMHALSEEIEAADAERLAAEEQRLLANLTAYRQSEGNFMNKLFGTMGKGASIVSSAPSAYG